VTDSIITDTATRIFADLCEPATINAAEEGTWPEALWNALEELNVPIGFHPTGNTSLKEVMRDRLGAEVEVLRVKATGADMAMIDLAGLPAVRLAPLRRLRALGEIGDDELVGIERASLIDPAAANPSVEIMLHAFLPHKFVDHTHATAVLSVIDQQWKDHLLSMDHLKEGIGLRGYGQHDPLVEYKKESFDMFEAMMQRFQEDTVRYLYLMQILERPPDAGAGGPPPGAPVGQGPRPAVPSQHDGDGNGKRPSRMVSTSADELEEAFMRRKRRELEQARMAGAGDAPQVQQVGRGQEQVGRNEPCPCWSGKKYKT